MKKFTLYIAIAISLFTISCNKDKDPILIEPAPVVEEFTQIFVLDSIIYPNSNYVDTIKVTSNNLTTTSPHTYGVTWNAVISATYAGCCNQYLINNQLLNTYNPSSAINGHYFIKNDSLTYLFQTNNTINYNYGALYLKIN